MIPRWTPGDVVRLKERVSRHQWCAECFETNHGHKAARVGPYTLCRCLACPTLVVRP